MSTRSTTIEQVERWLDTVVIGHNFCPFAAFVKDQQQIRYALSDSTDVSALLATLRQEISLLDSDAKVATTLLILTSAWHDFDDYLLLVDQAQQSLRHWGYEGQYQLASFHPHYLFAGEPANAASHFTNRSPLPILHILREADITAALQHCDDPAAIPARNIDKANALGVEHLQQQLDACAKPR